MQSWLLADSIVGNLRGNSISIRLQNVNGKHQAYLMGVKDTRSIESAVWRWQDVGELETSDGGAGQRGRRQGGLCSRRPPLVPTHRIDQRRLPCNP